MQAFDHSYPKHLPRVVMACIHDFDEQVLMPWLDDLERDRAARFRQQVDRQRFVIAHVLKRYLLAEYLQVESAQLLFTANDHGKPFCLNVGAPFFNISHSGDFVAVAIATAEVGIDIEFARSLDHLAIIERICSPKELQQFQSMPDSEQAFLCFWTQKEAVSKAYGKGLSAGWPEIPCSGLLGEHSVCFLNDSYWFRTLELVNGGILTVSLAGEHSSAPSLPLHKINSQVINDYFC